MQLGEWSYTLQGQGVPPTVMDPILVACALGEVTQTLLPFKNPLDEPITVSCKLLEKNRIENKGESLADNNKVTIPPLFSLS